MALVELRRCYTGIEADVMRSVLAAEGIDSYVFDAQMNFGGLDGAIPVRLMVDDEDLAHARMILD